MKGQLKAATPAEYLAQLTEPRKSDVSALDALMRKTAPKHAPFIHSGMLAYGPFRFKYDSGRENDWFRIGIASNAQYISMYVSGIPADSHKAALPKAKIGKGCVRFKRLADLDESALKKLIKEVGAAAAS